MNRFQLLACLASSICSQHIIADDLQAPSASSSITQMPILIEKVQGFVLTGNPHVLEEIAPDTGGIQFIEIDVPGGKKGLEKLLEKYLGRSLTAEDLQQIKREIILYYRDHNHPLLSVYIPEQQITYGVVQFVVQESVLSQVNVYGNKHFSTKRYTNAIKLKKGEPIDENVLLNNLNFINRNPFRRADLIYAPGADPQTTDIELLVKDRFPLSVYAGVDNTGLVHTDRTRWFAGFTWGNAFNLDQIFSFQYTAAPNPHKFNAFTVSYTVPLPVQHILMLYGGYSRVNVHLPQSSNTHGTSGQASIRYDIPIAPSPWLLHEITCGFDFKRSNNTVEFVENFPVIGQEVNLTQFMCGYNLGYQRDHDHWSHKVGFDLELFFSPFSWIPDQSNQDFQSLNPFATHTYVYGRSSLTYKIHLPKEFQWTALAQMQLSNQSLLPSEQFGLGGYNTVRGYEERQLNADDGLLLSTEIHSPKFKLFKKCGKCKVNDALEFLIFLDYGLSHDNHRLSGEKQTDYLLGTGPGIRYAIEKYLSARLDWGIKLHKNDFPGGWSMVHFSVIGSF
ncbi:MAG: ShlB/FhaC/HecB family hemolysin secretion/activation protein [Verrucomicrobia bacterium]|nr:ShlB/FhaC/HecB family hemolysin secretion/activation protein [Verrucomicrobiota bacterium]